MTVELSRLLPARDIGSAVRHHRIEATAAECAALAARFGLVELASLSASFDVRRDAAGIRITGSLAATGSQPCVATADPVPFAHEEAVALLLTESLPEGDEIELGADDLDSEPLLGDIVDLGEIAAQALGLALDPYPRSAQAAVGVISESEARAAASPFAVLRRPT